ncbi:MAG: hypothetical protein HRT44_06820 [Bdellovibrionales bacterium]|nr:hypothetical protein [Bdellovibrionales bacterium]NQZ18951.1 hypothetical protein [Bdellovibrionales bacterium]
MQVRDQKVVYFKTVETNNTPFTITASAFSNPTANSYVSKDTSGLSDSDRTLRLIPDFERAPELEVATTELCVPFNVVAFHTSGASTEMATFGTVTFGMTDIASATPGLFDQAFYISKVDCENGNSTNKLLSLGNDPTDSDPYYTIWFRQATGNATTYNNLLTTCSGASTCDTANANISVVTPGSFSNLKVVQTSPVQPINLNGCAQFLASAYDDHKPNPYPVPFGSDGDFFFGPPTGPNLAGTFHTDPTCMSSTTDMPITGTDLDENFWISSTATLNSAGIYVFSVLYDGDNNNTVQTTGELELVP